jgi:O-antigen/teichoic acid export membrane protein
MCGVVILIRHLRADMGSGELQIDTKLRRLYLQGLRHMNLISVTIFAFLIAIAEPLIIAWVGEEYATTATLVCLLATGNMILQSTGPVTLIFRGIDRCGREFELLIVQLVLALVWVPAGVISWGLTGAALAITAVNSCAAFFFFWRSNHLFQVGFQHFAAHTLKPTLLPLSVATAVYLVTRIWPYTQQATAILQVIVLGLVYLCLVCLLAWKLVLTEDEKAHVLALNPFHRLQKQPL